MFIFLPEVYVAHSMHRKTHQRLHPQISVASTPQSRFSKTNVKNLEKSVVTGTLEIWRIRGQDCRIKSKKWRNRRFNLTQDRDDEEVTTTSSIKRDQTNWWIGEDMNTNFLVWSSRRLHAVQSCGPCMHIYILKCNCRVGHVMTSCVRLLELL